MTRSKTPEDVRDRLQRLIDELDSLADRLGDEDEDGREAWERDADEWKR